MSDKKTITLELDPETGKATNSATGETYNARLEVEAHAPLNTFEVVADVAIFCQDDGYRLTAFSPDAKVERGAVARVAVDGKELYLDAEHARKLGEILVGLADGKGVPACLS